LSLLGRWRTETENAGHEIRRMVAAFETEPDGFSLARWLARHIEAHVISCRECRGIRRARGVLETRGLKRSSLNLHGEPELCKMAAARDDHS